MIVHSRVEEVDILTLSRPLVLNAIDTAMADDLAAALDRAARSDAIALVLTGAGRAFCAGSDLREPGVELAGKIDAMQAVVGSLLDFPKLTVAAINGLALGGGLELAMGCMMRVAAPEAKLGLPESRMGLMPGFGGTQLLPRLIGEARALAMILTGDSIDAAEALHLGLLYAVAENPLDAALALTRRCAKGHTAAVRAIRSAVTASRAEGREGFALEARLAKELAANEDVEQAIARYFAPKSAEAAGDGKTG